MTIQEKTKRMHDLAELLAKSTSLQSFEPRAFADGKSCVVGATGNMRNKPREVIWYVKKDTGEKYEYKALDVPFDLWPSSLQAEYMEIPRYRRPAIK